MPIIDEGSPEGVEAMFTRYTPHVNEQLFSEKPVLGVVPNGQYQGRVFVEVWDKGENIVGFPSQLKRAFADLSSNRVHLHRQAIRNLVNQPISGTVQGGAFLGYLVIELWNNQTVVGTTGSSQQQVLNRMTRQSNR